jgi:hypothetical protein
MVVQSANRRVGGEMWCGLNGAAWLQPFRRKLLVWTLCIIVELR